MDRRVALTVAVVVLVATAGCSALPMWDDDTGATAGTPTPTEAPDDVEAADDVPEADADADHGDGPDVTYPDGYGPHGVEEPDTASSNHVSAMLEYDSYIFGYDSLIRDGDAETTTTIQLLVDQRGETAMVLQDAGQGAQATYYEDDTAYTREETGESVEYDSNESAYSMSDFTGAQFVGPLLANAEFGSAEVFDTDAGMFYRYTSEEVHTPEGILRSQVEDDRIDRFEVTIVVDENGAVRRAVYVVEADVDLTVNMGVSEVGSLDLDRPEWFDEAASS